MRCDCCPLCPIAEDDVCPECEGKYGIEHADGMLGCKHPETGLKRGAMSTTPHSAKWERIWGLKWTLPQRSLQK